MDSTAIVGLLSLLGTPGILASNKLPVRKLGVTQEKGKSI